MASREYRAVVFWPEHCAAKPSGYLVGYNIKSSIACVVGVVHGDIAAVDAAIQKTSRELGMLAALCMGPPVLLGEWIDPTGQSRVHRSTLVRKKTSDIWLTMQCRGGAPVLRELHCCGYRYTSSLQLVMYQQPSPDAWLVVEPGEVDTRRYTVPGDWTSDISTLGYILRQINYSRLVERELEDELGTGEERVPAAQGAGRVNERRYLLLQPLVVLLVAAQGLAWALTWALNTKLPPEILHGFRLKDLSTFGCEVDHRMQQLLELPARWQLFRHWRTVPALRAHHIAAVNDLVMAAVNLVLGWAAAWYLLAHTDAMLDLINDQLHAFNVDFLHDQIEWMMGWPAGFKLNDHLDDFLGNVFLFLVQVWASLAIYVQPYQRALYLLVAYSGLCGLSPMLSLSADVVGVLFCHLFWFYYCTARLYLLQLNALSALWRLFRGKKRNMLRARIDSHEYDLEQMLMGTLLFSLIFFLFPTTTAYYLLFTLLRICTVTVQFLLIGGLSILRCLPLYSVFLWCFRPDRLPGGIELDIVPPEAAPDSKADGRAESKPPHEEETTTAPLLPPGADDERAMSPPVSPGAGRAGSAPSLALGRMRASSRSRKAKTVTRCRLLTKQPALAPLFFDFAQLVSAARKHYKPKSLLGSLVVGETVPPIPALANPRPPPTLAVPEFWVMVRSVVGGA